MRPKQKSANGPDVIFSGARKDHHFRVDIGGKPILLAQADMMALIQLVVARIQGDSGFLHILRGTIGKLRKALGPARRLIATGSGEEYRLAIPKNKIAERIGVTASFFELTGKGLMSENDAKLLRETCRLCDVGEDND